MASVFITLSFVIPKNKQTNHKKKNYLSIYAHYYIYEDELEPEVKISPVRNKNPHSVSNSHPP